MLFASCRLSIFVCDYKQAWLTSPDAYPQLSALEPLEDKKNKKGVFSFSGQRIFLYFTFYISHHRDEKVWQKELRYKKKQ